MPPGMDVEQFADFTPSYDQISLSSISPNFSFSATNSVVGYNMQDINSRLNDRMVKGRNNVIMIPPTMPRPNIPMIPNIKAEGSKLKGKGDGKRPLDASDDPKSAKNIKSSSQSSADNQPRGDDKDSVETQKVERRYNIYYLQYSKV